MENIKDLRDKYYEEFKGLPSNSPIVRNKQISDAFELVVLKVLYSRFLPDFKKENAHKFAEYIISPPDNSIDIFFQHDNGDESSFDVIQVKDRELTESEIKNCIVNMERTIEDYISDPKTIKSESCKEILSKSDLEKSNANKCTYYVVHTGKIDDFSSSKENEKVLTKKSLEIILNNRSEYVDEDTFDISASMSYGDNGCCCGALVCSINGYTLANLCNNYFNTEIGRNILFGSNLRESLITKKAKAYLSMSKTIKENPEKFWYYNNGITIIAKDFNLNTDGSITVKGFSIVNGAQTTSAMGLFLKEAIKNQENDLIEKLKKVFVMARILKVPDKNMRQDIAIFNNTQNPITSRDMVANQPEQLHLHEWLLDAEMPQIYVEIRRGSKMPSSFDKTIQHRKTNNEKLAQLAYAAFLQKPYTAKDKKSTLFNNDYSQDEYRINKIYHEVFNWNDEKPDENGILFKKSKNDIDEALFVQQIYTEAKKVLKKQYEKNIEKAKSRKKDSNSSVDIKRADDTIIINELYRDVVGICMFYYIALYYEFKAQLEEENNKQFDIQRYYDEKSFKEDLVKESASFFLSYTVKILVNTATANGKSGNVNNWIRSAGCENQFYDSLRSEIVSNNLELQEKYNRFCEQFKI